MAHRPRWLLAAAVTFAAALGCQSQPIYDASNPTHGPGGMVGNDGPITSGLFAGGSDPIPAARATTPPDDTRPPDCDQGCIDYCTAQNLENPVNRGLCRSLWGVGLSAMPVDRVEACRRLFVDLLGRLPSAAEVDARCQGDWATTVRGLMADDAFVFVNQRRTADRFLYSTQVENVESVYDLDRLTEKLYRGLVPYDLYAQVVSAHPVFTRRIADPKDRVEALFKQFLGRPPFENERADMARLYGAWANDYYDHPQLNVRMPDAYLKFRCLTDTYEVDPEQQGECTSVLWGYNELIFTPDIRATYDREQESMLMWNGLLKPEEWAKLQIPGRILSRDIAFWEKAVDDVVEQYLGYNLDQVVPEVRRELVRYLLENKGDLRSVHYALATSVAYLQSGTLPSTTVKYRWTYGPLKQVDAEVWIDSMSELAGYQTAACDHRISQPQDFLQSGSLAAYKLIDQSRWQITEAGEIDQSYSDVARTLGGCPENVVGGRFRVTSILTTATQLNFVNELCNPGLDKNRPAAPIERLLPEGMAASKAVTPDLAEQIAAHQYRALLGREPTATERTEARDAGTQCQTTLCSAEQFARPMCFALLSSAEMLFY